MIGPKHETNEEWQVRQKVKLAELQEVAKKRSPLDIPKKFVERRAHR